jgi:hypothetical protein
VRRSGNRSTLIEGDDRFGLFRTWEVDESLPSVEYYSDSELGAEIAGAELEVSSYLALPGRYEVHAAEHPLLTSDPSSFVVTTSESRGPGLDPEVKPEALEDARTVVEEAIAGCTASTELPLENCPFLTSWSSWYYGDVTDVAIKVTTAPEFSLEYDSYYGGLVIATEEYGEYTLTGMSPPTYSFGAPTPEPFEEESRFSVDGVVTGSGDDLEVEFD